MVAVISDVCFGPDIENEVQISLTVRLTKAEILKYINLKTKC